MKYAERILHRRLECLKRVCLYTPLLARECAKAVNMVYPHVEMQVLCKPKEITYRFLYRCISSVAEHHGVKLSRLQGCDEQTLSAILIPLCDLFNVAVTINGEFYASADGHRELV